MALKNYILIKQVQALRIVSVGNKGNLKLEDRSIVQRPAGTAYVPKAGDYYMVLPDGYITLSPQKAFEDTYAPASDEVVSLLSTVANNGLEVPAAPEAPQEAAPAEQVQTEAEGQGSEPAQA